MQILQVIIAILAFGVIIVVHELGHFTAAKIFRMKVYEFSIGMGPAIFKHKAKNQTQFSLRAVPFGAYVALGEDNEAEADDPTAFRNKPVWQRMIVILAGVFMNFVLGLIICLIMVATEDRIIGTTIAGFDDGSSTNGSLQVGDQIVAVNGLTVFTASDISYQLYNTSSKMAQDENTALFDFTVSRDGKNVELQDVKFAAVPNADGGHSIDIDWYVGLVPKTVPNVIAESFRESATLTRLIFISLIDIVKGTYGLNDFAGPVGVISEISSVAATVDISMFLTMFALITLNVALFNLLPIPGLDGARFCFFLLELIRGKPVKAEVEGVIHFVGLAALMVFMIIVTFNDIRKLIFGG
jgi:regulator of sigma E protease